MALSSNTVGMIIVASYNLHTVSLPILVVLSASGAALPVQFTEGQSETFDPWVYGGQGTGPKILVNINNVTKYCGEDIILRVGEIRTFEESLSEGDEPIGCLS